MELPVHPHVRGVYDLPELITRPGGAVHPHVRGVYGQRLVGRDIIARSIPTCVGFTSAPIFTWVDATVHPHVRGVYFAAAVASLFPRRSIPTYVGFT